MEQQDAAAVKPSISLEQLREVSQQFAERACRLFRLRALLWLIVWMLLVAVAAVAIDYLFHVEELGLRWLLTLVCLGGWCGLIYRFIKVDQPRGIDPVSTASWVERHHPQLRGRLSTLVALSQLPDQDLRYGAASFRRAALDQNAEELAGLNWQSFLDFRPTIRAAIAVGGFVVLIVVCGLAWPTTFRLGLTRLFLPWAYAPWPRADELQFVELPKLIAAGRELDIAVIDQRPPLPTAVQLEVRHRGAGHAPSETRSLQMQLLEGMAVGTLPEMRSDFEVRAVGGDDLNGPWQEVRVAELPRLVEQQFRVEPPAYSGQPTSQLVGQRIEVLAGSKVTFSGKFSGPMKSIQAISLPTPQDSPKERANIVSSEVSKGASNATTQADDETARWTATLGSDQLSFQLFSASSDESLVQHERRWQLEVETADGLTAIDPATWSIRVVADRLPQVNFASLEPSKVTREATVEIEGIARDDLGLSQVDLVWRVNSSEQTQRQSLWQANSIPRRTNASASDTLHQAATHASVATQWRPAEHKLVAGQSVTLVLEATDTLGQVAQSVPRTLEIDASEAVLAALQLEQAKAVEPLRDILQQQQRNLQSITRIRDILQATPQVEPAQVDAVASARQLQQAIAGQLARAPESVLNQLRSLADQFEHNALQRSKPGEELAGLLSAVEHLSADAIDPALNSLGETQKALRDALVDGSEKKQSLARNQLESALAQQQQVISRMQRMVGSVDNAQAMVDVQKQIRRLLSEQNSLRQQAEQLQLQTVVGQSRGADYEGKRVGLRSDQQSLARSADEIAQQIDQQLASVSRGGANDRNNSGSPTNSDPSNSARPSAAELPQTKDPTTGADHAANETAGAGTQPAWARTLSRIQHALIDQQLGDRMREAAILVDAKQFGQALEVQNDVTQALQEIVDAFGTGADGGIASSKADLLDVARELDQLASREEGIATQIKREADASELADTIQQQRELAQAVQEFIDSLPASAPRGVLSAVDQALQSARQSMEAIDKTQIEEGQRLATQAANQLRQAGQATEERMADLDKQRAAQKLLDLKPEFEALLEQQRPYVDLLNSLQGGPVAEGQGAKPTATAAELRNAATTQERIRKQLEAIQADGEEIETFDWLLNNCARDMGRAVAALQRGRLAPDAIDAATAALEQLVAASEALTNSTSKEAQSEATENQDAQAQDNSGNSKKNLPSLASLRLLRSLQQRVNQQTQSLESRGLRSDDPQMQRLADDQQALSEQVDKLMEQLQR